jgi:preprotein translocase subunit SecA
MRELADLRQAVAFSAVAQRDPLDVYQREAAALFGAFKAQVVEDLACGVFRAAPVDAPTNSPA